MSNSVRPFAALISLGWIAAWLGVFWLLVRPEYRTSLELTDLTLTGDIAAGGVARWLAAAASIVAAALALPVLTAALLPERGRTAARPADTVLEWTPATTRVPGGARAGVPALPRVAALVPEDDARGHAEVSPASLRRRPTDGGTTVTAPSPPVPEARGGDLDTLRARLDRQEEEIRRLRELVMRGAPTTAAPGGNERVPNGGPP
jgi:hypothetical protein